VAPDELPPFPDAAEREQRDKYHKVPKISVGCVPGDSQAGFFQVSTSLLPKLFEIALAVRNSDPNRKNSPAPAWAAKAEAAAKERKSAAPAAAAAAVAATNDSDTDRALWLSLFPALANVCSRRPGWEFSNSITTNGVQVNVLIERQRTESVAVSVAASPGRDVMSRDEYERLQRNVTTADPRWQEAHQKRSATPLTGGGLARFLVGLRVLQETEEFMHAFYAVHPFRQWRLKFFGSKRVDSEEEEEDEEAHRT
jgi:hypothetical protein